MPCFDQVDGWAVFRSSTNKGREFVLCRGVTPRLPTIACEDIRGLIIASRHRIRHEVPWPRVPPDEVDSAERRGDAVERGIPRSRMAVGLAREGPRRVRVPGRAFGH